MSKIWEVLKNKIDAVDQRDWDLLRVSLARMMSFVVVYLFAILLIFEVSIGRDMFFCESDEKGHCHAAKFIILGVGCAVLVLAWLPDCTIDAITAFFHRFPYLYAFLMACFQATLMLGSKIFTYIPAICVSCIYYLVAFFFVLLLFENMRGAYALRLSAATLTTAMSLAVAMQTKGHVGAVPVVFLWFVSVFYFLVTGQILADARARAEARARAD